MHGRDARVTQHRGRDARAMRERVPSLHRSRILRDSGAMQAVAEELSGYAGKFLCFLKRRV